MAIDALPKIQDELSLSDAGRKLGHHAYVLTFADSCCLAVASATPSAASAPSSSGLVVHDCLHPVRHRWDESTLVTARLLQGVGAAIGLADRVGADRPRLPQGPGPQHRERRCSLR